MLLFVLYLAYYSWVLVLALFFNVFRIGILYDFVIN